MHSPSKDCRLPKYLLDEQLSPDVAAALMALSRTRGDEFHHVYDLSAGGTDDADIPALCATEGIYCVISANVRDFGARKAIYIELMRAGQHVVVLRFGKARPIVELQMHLLSGALPKVRAILTSATEPTLIRVSASGDCAVRSIDELIDELTGAERPPLP